MVGNILATVKFWQLTKGIIMITQDEETALLISSYIYFKTLYMNF